ncbi:MAG: NTP transferase domain-containing protein [Bacteroidia bacterium]
MQKLYGLVVCGGQSSRMGTDKSLLQYHDLPQRYYLYNLLDPLCDKVFLSCNKHQAAEINEFYNLIIDIPDYFNIGPIAALLSAYRQFPEASFLVIGCDYPFIKENDLKKLVANRDVKKQAVYYFNPESNFEEPLLAIYENSCLPILLENFEKGNFSLRHFLKSINSEKIYPESLESLTSVDTVEQYQEVLLKIKNE